ncbi:efflux transporter outer membrane subunit [Brevundimonas sp. PAMC22021]|uniref:efflux transporter outer membrane subunit n=1 Tax=Brevundimonas sp. PAMC22021 TaxID=2861285 RepID=UPI001C636CC0|nr:efflux transporter outer membrane subunit [Brevundimonas sp. PAMC22021]QYF87397.1 efflux transporter outer membrane subunit [Brevundimonas sp. PAMC22021]
MIRPLHLLVCGAVLAGCAQVPTPSPVKPGVPVAYAPIAEPGNGPRATEIAWRDFFGDPRLLGLIEQALENNRDLRAAVARIDEAAALRRIARADRVPTIDANASASFGNGQGAQGGSGQSGQSGGGEQYRVGLGLSAFELDFWGRVRNLEVAALAEYLATVEAQRAFQLSLVADLADAYLTGRELEERRRLALDAIASRERSLYLARRLFEEGEGSDLEVQQEIALLTDAQSQLADIDNQSAAAANLLQLLVGAPPSPDLPGGLPLDDQRIVETVSAGLPSELLLARPDILEAEQTLRASEANVAAARAALFPTISLTAALGFASPELSRLFSSESDYWSVSSSLTQPLFDAGRRRAQIAAEDAGRRVALAEYERTVQTAFREVSDALAARRFLAEQRRALAASRAAQGRRLELAQLRFDVGEVAAVDVLEARRELFSADQAIATLRAEELRNAVALYIALGGGLR